MRYVLHQSLIGALLLLLFILSGCAGRIPKTLPLSDLDHRAAERTLADFYNRQVPTALDADVKISWDSFAAQGSVGAVLQLQQPGLLRLAAVDPLGRSQFIVAAGGREVVLVETMAAKVYEGDSGSALWRSYISLPLVLEDFFPLLGGMLDRGRLELQQVARDVEQTGFWYTFTAQSSVIHRVLLDEQTGLMGRHLITDTDGAFLDLTYADYRESNKTDYLWPRDLVIKGDKISGSVSLEVNRIYSHDQLSQQIFQLTYPAHYKVIPVQ